MICGRYQYGENWMNLSCELINLFLFDKYPWYYNPPSFQTVRGLTNVIIHVCEMFRMKRVSEHRWFKTYQNAEKKIFRLWHVLTFKKISIGPNLHFCFLSFFLSVESIPRLHFLFCSWSESDHETPVPFFTFISQITHKLTFCITYLGAPRLRARIGMFSQVVGLTDQTRFSRNKNYWKSIIKN